MGGGGVFVKKVENGGFVNEKWKWGCFVKKSGHFLDAGCIMYSISIFTFYLFGGCICTLPVYGPEQRHVSACSATLSAYAGS